ncbi:hypothetical protein HCN44_000815 [Aphidius gifuensis]|uniref:Uncharacterized protein n=1 Tax=Aphidius gifuensis TaxID=684658 RepID=A0A835CS87_APHGI|nr:hypothetical protein HCN44_000815 [Aphidius gifuensis]
MKEGDLFVRNEVNGMFTEYDLASLLTDAFESQKLYEHIDSQYEASIFNYQENANTFYDISSGQQYLKIEREGGLKKYDLFLLWNTDGAPVSNSSYGQLWPIQLQILNISPKIRRSFQLVAGLYYSQNQKPKSSGFLEPFVKALEKLSTEGFHGTIHNKLIHVPEAVRLWGPIWAWSNYPFEDGNYFLIHLNHGPNKVDLEIANTLKYYNCLKILNNQLNITEVDNDETVVKTLGSEKLNNNLPNSYSSAIKISHDNLMLHSENIPPWLKSLSVNDDGVITGFTLKREKPDENKEQLKLKKEQLDEQEKRLLRQERMLNRREHHLEQQQQRPLQQQLKTNTKQPVTKTAATNEQVDQHQLTSSRSQEILKVPLYNGSNVSVDKFLLQELKTEWQNNPKHATRLLLIHLVGKEELKTMTKTGKNNRKSIPEVFMIAIEGNQIK